MSPRARIFSYGTACVLVVIGGAAAALFPGLTGELLATALISIGLGGVVLLIFYEVGLSEDRERAEEAERDRRAAERRARRSQRLPRSHRPRWPRRPA
jgi:hypothetical protein